MINWYACSMTKVKINSEQATALINYDLIMSSCPSRSSNHRMITAGTQYTNGLALSPQCAPPTRYDGRMTTNSSTSRPAADARVPASFDEWITTDDLARRAAAVQRVFAESIKWDDESMIDFDYGQRHLARCLGCRMAMINCEC
jgi:hypothetical protein